MHDNFIRFSVIVPVYNAEKTLNRCIDSLLDPNRSDFEILLINDGSTDESKAICELYAARDVRVRFIDKENGGVSTARNAGLDEARGSYITFVDSDDYVDPMYFNAIEQALEHGRWDLVRFAWILDDGKNVQERRAVPLAAKTRQEALQRIIDDICSKALNSPWGKVYRKELIDRYAIRFPVGVSVAEDRAFNISYSIHVQQYRVCEQPIYFVNTQNENSLSRKRHQDLDEQFRIADEYTEQAITETKIPENEKGQFRQAINFGKMRGIYREAKALHRDGVSWLKRQQTLWRRCGQINRLQMQYPSTKYCRIIAMPVTLRLTVVIDAVAKKLLN